VLDELDFVNSSGERKDNDEGFEGSSFSFGERTLSSSPALTTAYQLMATTVILTLLILLLSHTYTCIERSSYTLSPWNVSDNSPHRHFILPSYCRAIVRPSKKEANFPKGKVEPGLGFVSGEKFRVDQSSSIKSLLHHIIFNGSRA